ncbi:hypothetical protein C8R45DRAFT_297547 [Mycena sanguinolenta]|nr:hypothetical protein C8R45DRAFT_297547 [Mycena sanguinolenta]
MFPHAKGWQTMNNYIGGGTGGAGGPSHGNAPGGAGGQGMGPSLNFDISTRNFTVNNLHHHGERGIDILHGTVSLAAIHDSMESFPQPKCHPETRAKMLEDLHKWALDPHPETTILWLWGPAGAGKSAIMQTLARQLQVTGKLGGSFFFKRGHATCGNGKTLVTTIAYQLALSVPWLKAPISQAVENDPSIVARCIETQMQRLVSDPCRPYENRDPVAIIVDGLDECEGHDIQEEILHAIRTASSHSPSPLRFIVASRPEPHIREVFDSSLYSDVRRFSVEQSFADIRKYLRDEFSRIHREHWTMARVPSPWPESKVLENLVRNSSGHFIYASTVIKFIDDKNYRPTDRLAVVEDRDTTRSVKAFDPLDQLYMSILQSAARQSELVPILCAIANFDLTVGEIDELFELVDGDTRLMLRGLHSVLLVPENDEEPIYSHHASFLDFLDNPSRSHNFHASGLDARMDLARRFLGLCARRYQIRWSTLYDAPGST